MSLNLILPIPWQLSLPALFALKRKFSKISKGAGELHVKQLSVLYQFCTALWKGNWNKISHYVKAAIKKTQLNLRWLAKEWDTVLKGFGGTEKRYICPFPNSPFQILAFPSQAIIKTIFRSIWIFWNINIWYAYFNTWTWTDVYIIMLNVPAVFMSE
jgi:hypothetical protein